MRTQSRARRTPPEHRPGAADARGGIVRVGTSAAIPAVLESFGVNPAEVLGEAGLAPALFDDPDNTISYDARGRLVLRCVARTGCRHFGLLVGQRSGLSSLGLVGFLVRHSPDVGTALRRLERHFHVHARRGIPTLTVQGDSAMLGFAVHGAGEAADQIVDGAAAIEFNILRELCGPDWRPTEILFAHGEPEDVRPFRRYFRAPLRFGAQHTGPVFPAHWLRRRLAGDDPGLSRLLQKQLEALEGRYGDDFPEQVRRVLGTSLLSGPTRVDQVAALFGMHSRTLNRRLHAFGTTFKHLVEQGRFEIARQLLEQSGKDMSEIAAVLGYSEPSAFTRAFRRWSGLTPYLWRRERRAGDSRRA